MGKHGELYRVVITNETTGETVRDIPNVCCMFAAITPGGSDESVGVGFTCCNAQTILGTIDTAQKVLERVTLHGGVSALGLLKVINSIGESIGHITKEETEEEGVTRTEQAQTPTPPTVH